MQVYLRILEDLALPYDTREVAMESLVDLVRQRDFMTQLYTNFDTDLTSGIRPALALGLSIYLPQKMFSIAFFDSCVV